MTYQGFVVFVFETCAYSTHCDSFPASSSARIVRRALSICLFVSRTPAVYDEKLEAPSCVHAVLVAEVTQVLMSDVYSAIFVVAGNPWYVQLQVAGLPISYLVCALL